MDAAAAQPPVRLLLQCLRDHEDDVLRFLADLGYRPTRTRPTERAPGRNPAEDLRPAPLRAGHPAPPRHPGYISTAAKHGTSAFAALRHALTEDPWMPAPPVDAGSSRTSTSPLSLQSPANQGWIESQPGGDADP